eukprot:SAG31_NODE_27390_length_426_cov_3.681957_1_plen_65_part_01
MISRETTPVHKGNGGVAKHQQLRIQWMGHWVKPLCHAQKQAHSICMTTRPAAIRSSNNAVLAIQA